jgi:hypothetical protein
MRSTGQIKTQFLGAWRGMGGMRPQPQVGQDLLDDVGLVIVEPQWCSRRIEQWNRTRPKLPLHCLDLAHGLFDLRLNVTNRLR